jgi:ribosomal protein L9
MASSAQNKTNHKIANRYAEEERKRREGTAMDKSLADEIEAKRQARMQAADKDGEISREFAVNLGTTGDELRQGLQIKSDMDGDTDA